MSGAGATGPNGENGGLGGTIEGSFADTDKEGTTRATVTDGTITTRDAAGQAALEDAGRTDTVAALNRDDAKAQEVTKDDATGFDFYASDTSVKKAAEAVETAGKTLKQIVDAIADELAKAGEISEEDKEAAKGPDGEVNIGMPCPSDRECTDRLRAELKAAALAKYLEDLEAGRLEGNSQLPEGATEAADYIRRFIEENPDAVIVGKSILASSGFLSAALTRAAIKNMGGDQAALDEFDAILRQGGEQVTERLENWALVYAAQHNLSQKDLNTLNTFVAAAGAIGGVVASGATRLGVKRNNPAAWRTTRDLWDQSGYGSILSVENRAAIAAGRVPKVDDDWIKHFPEDAGLKGEQINMHHVGGTSLTVPLPYSRHRDAHMPGGFKTNPGGPGAGSPFYPPKE